MGFLQLIKCMGVWIGKRKVGFPKLDELMI